MFVSVRLEMEMQVDLQTVKPISAYGANATLAVRFRSPAFKRNGTWSTLMLSLHQHQRPDSPASSAANTYKPLVENLGSQCPVELTRLTAANPPGGICTIS